MATGKNTQAIDRITPKTPTALTVAFSKNASTEQDVPLSTLDDLMYITKKQFDENSGGGTAPIETPITGGTTPNPITVAHTGMTWPSILCRNSDGSLYAGAQNSVDDGTNIILTGDDDGFGHFVDTFTFIIKV